MATQIAVPCKGSLNVHIGHDLHLAAALSATRQNVTLNDLTRQTLSEHMQRRA